MASSETMTKDLIFSKGLMSKIKGTLQLKDNKISFTDFNGQVVFSESLQDLTKAKQFQRKLTLYTKDNKYGLLFIHLNNRDNLSDAVNYGIAASGPIQVHLYEEERQFKASGVRKWFNALDKRGVPMKDSMFNTPKGYWVMLSYVLMWSMALFAGVSLLLGVLGLLGIGEQSALRISVQFAIGVIFGIASGFALLKLYKIKRY